MIKPIDIIISYELDDGITRVITSGITQYINGKLNILIQDMIITYTDGIFSLIENCKNEGGMHK